MSMQDLYPMAMAMVFALGILQLALFLLGFGGMDADAADGGLEVNGGFDAATDIDLGDGFDMPEADIANSVEAPSAAGWELLGSRQVPFLVRLVFFLAGFGGAGFMLSTLIGDATVIHRLIPLGGALLVGVILTKIFSGFFRKLVPGLETTAVNLGNMRRARGTVTVGTMTASQSAQVRITDRFGGQHNIMATTLHPDARINAGAEVVISRQLDPDTFRPSYLAVQIA